VPVGRVWALEKQASSASLFGDRTAGLCAGDEICYETVSEMVGVVATVSPAALSQNGAAELYLTLRRCFSIVNQMISAAKSTASANKTTPTTIANKILVIAWPPFASRPTCSRFRRREHAIHAPASAQTSCPCLSRVHRRSGT